MSFIETSKNIILDFLDRKASQNSRKYRVPYRMNLRKIIYVDFCQTCRIYLCDLDPDTERAIESGIGAYPDSGSGAFLTPGFGIRIRDPEPGTGTEKKFIAGIRDELLGSYF
jgi:hypothetical protein